MTNTSDPVFRESGPCNFSHRDPGPLPQCRLGDDKSRETAASFLPEPGATHPGPQRPRRSRGQALSPPSAGATAVAICTGRDSKHRERAHSIHRSAGELPRDRKLRSRCQCAVATRCCSAPPLRQRVAAHVVAAIANLRRTAYVRADGTAADGRADLGASCADRMCPGPALPLRLPCSGLSVSLACIPTVNLPVSARRPSPIGLSQWQVSAGRARLPMGF